MLVITTPNAEDLAENLNYCPFCDTEFHRWQHLRSLNHQDVDSLLRASGMTPAAYPSMDFSNFQSQVRLPDLADLSFRVVKDWINFEIMRTLDRYRPRPILTWTGVHFSPRQ